MSDTKVGDLVMVKHVHCDKSRLGTIFVVEDIRIDDGTCGTCGTYAPTTARAFGIPGYYSIPIAWLKRIPPLSELERVTEKEELHA